MKKALKITGWILALILLLLAAGLIAVQSPKVQTALGRRAAQMLQDKTDADIRIGMVSVSPFNALTLTDILVLDSEPRVSGADTLLSLGSLSVKFTPWGIFQSNGVHVSRAWLKHVSATVVSETDSLTGKSTTNIQRIFRLTDDPDKEPDGWGNLASARSVTLEDVHFRLLNPALAREQRAKGFTVAPGVIDWNDLDAVAEQIEVEHLKVKDSHISGKAAITNIRELHAGMLIHHVSASQVKVGQERARIEDLRIQDSETDMRLSRLELLGNIADYGEFIEKIRIEADIRSGAAACMHTLRHFGPGLDRNTARARFTGGKVSGYVNDLHLENIRLTEINSGASIHLSGSLLGLPEVSGTLIDFQIKDLAFTLKGLGDFLEAWDPASQLDLSGLAGSRETFHFAGGLKGPLSRFNLNGQIDSDLGAILADALLCNVTDPDRDIRIGGRLETRNLHLGRLLGADALGPLSLRTTLDATLKDSGPEVRIDSLAISRLHALDYDYSGISAAGTYSGKAFDGRIIAADPNLNFLFQGKFNLSPRTQNAAYRFYASLGYADLHALHLDKRERSKLSLEASSNFIRTRDKDLLGDIQLSDIVLESVTGRHEIGDITVQSHSNDNLHRIRIRSGVLNASYVGGQSIARFPSDLRSLLIDRELPALAEHPAPAWDGAPYEVKLTVEHAQDLLNFFVPGLYVEDGTSLGLKVDENGRVDASLHSKRLALSDKFLKDVNLSFSNVNEELFSDITFSVLALGDVQLLGNRVQVFADDNHVGLGYTFDNEDDAARAELYMTADLSRDAEGLVVDAHTLPSNIYYQGNGWGVTSGALHLQGGNLKVNRLLARHEDESICIDGGISSGKADTLSVNLEQFSLSLLNTFTGGSPSLEGRATGEALVISPLSPMPGLLAHISCDSTRISGARAGTVRLESVWNEEASRFDMKVSNTLDGKNNLRLDGWLVPSSSTLHATARMDGMDLAYADFLLGSTFKPLQGALSGTVNVDGRVDKPGRLKLSGQGLRLDRGVVGLDFLQVPYLMSGDLGLDDGGLHFKDVRLNDGKNGRGRLQGTVALGDFTHIGLDVHIQTDKLQLMNIAKGTNPSFYGNIAGTGRVDVTGDLSKIHVLAEMTTNEGSFHLPIGNVSGSRSSDILTFTEPVVERELDPYEVMLAASPKATQQATELDIKLRVEATPDLSAHIELSDENALTASGNGNIAVDFLSPQGSFGLGGYYTISQGDFHFSAMNLVQRNFTIQEGSTVRFNGDVMDTDLDVHGLYTTKASLANLIADEEAAMNRRTVLCGINITDKLRNPQVAFTIDVPDLNPSVQAQVESALNTEDKIQKQFLYLLLAGSFLPSEESGITSGGSEVLMSNVSSIMSGQLNNIFQKLNIPLDLGLNYQATEAGNNLFDVALSTQLFNNRVIVNGTLGNRQNLSGVTTNEVAGDLDIEVKMSRSGDLRLNLFSHSADQLSSYLDNSQRNGVGFTYQRDFNTFAQFLREFFLSAKQREALAVEEALKTPETIVLQIDSCGRANPVKP